MQTPIRTGLGVIFIYRFKLRLLLFVLLGYFRRLGVADLLVHIVLRAFAKGKLIKIGFTYAGEQIPA